MFRVLPVLPNLSVYRSSSILRPSISGLLSPIQEPSDSEIALEEIGKMNGVSVYRCLNRCLSYSIRILFRYSLNIYRNITITGDWLEKFLVASVSRLKPYIFMFYLYLLFHKTVNVRVNELNC